MAFDFSQSEGSEKMGGLCSGSVVSNSEKLKDPNSTVGTLLPLRGLRAPIHSVSAKCRSSNVSYNLILEVTSQQFLRALWVTEANPGTMWGWGLHKGVNTRRWRPSWLPQVLLSQINTS